MLISQMLAELTQTVVFDAMIKSRAVFGNLGLSVIAHKATWVSRRRFKHPLPETASRLPRCERQCLQGPRTAPGNPDTLARWHCLNRNQLSRWAPISSDENLAFMTLLYGRQRGVSVTGGGAYHERKAPPREAEHARLRPTPYQTKRQPESRNHNQARRR